MLASTKLIPARLEPGFSSEKFSGFMLALHALDISDITLVSGKPVWAKRHGLMLPVTDRVLQDSELRTLLSWMYGANAVAEISKGKPIDVRYEVHLSPEAIAQANQILQDMGSDHQIEVPRGQHRRIPFRMNAVGAHTPKGKGFSISLRTIPVSVPVLSDMGLPDSLYKVMNQSKGLTILAGETGSGKSTTLAAVMRDKLINSANRKIITIEAPIEFDLQGIRSESCLVVQHEIGQDLNSFYEGIVNALRQAPTDILVGEARDAESISGMIAAAETGHATYATVHASSVSGTLRRIANEFEPSAQSQVVFKVISQLRLVVIQRLMLAKSNGRRVPVREWLLFTDEFKGRILKMPMEEALTAIDDEVKSLGQTMRQQAFEAYRANLVEFRELKAVIGEVLPEEEVLLFEEDKYSPEES